MAAIASGARWGVRSLSSACAVASGLCFLAIFLVNVTQIGLRTFAGGGWIWVTDLSQLLFIWMVMLGTVAAYHEREHIVVDFLVSRFGGTREMVVAGLTRAVEIGLFVVLIRAGLEVTRVRGGISYIQLGVPTSWGFAAIPVGATVLLLVAIVLPLRFDRPEALDAIGGPDDPDEEGPDP